MTFLCKMNPTHMQKKVFDYYDDLSVYIQFI